MGFSLILRAFFSFPNERQFIECQFFWEFRVSVHRSEITRALSTSGHNKKNAASILLTAERPSPGSAQSVHNKNHSKQNSYRGFWNC